MTQAELETYRRQLLALRARLTGDLSHLSAEAFPEAAGGTYGNLSNMPLHLADLGTDNFERENTLRLLANEEHLLGEIDGALERLDEGTFGSCEQCRGPIHPRGRLREVPYTRFCIACARKLDANPS